MTRTSRNITVALLGASLTFVAAASALAGQAAPAAQRVQLSSEEIRVAAQFQAKPRVPAAPPAANVGGFVARAAGPDLQIQSFQFVPTNDKGLRVQIRNAGNQGASTHLLRLTVRRIDGTPVGRTMDLVVSSMNANETRWVNFNTASILPVDVAIADTTFKLNEDAGQHVSELNENNNEVWHNL